MWLNVYKLSDGQWHLWRSRTTETECGLDIETSVEERICGQKGSKKFPDPPKHELCRVCFNFLQF